MEELLVYAFLMEEGFPIENRYEEKLNELFMRSPDNEDLLELEFLSGKRKETAIYIRTHMDVNGLDIYKFGKEFMGVLKPVYESMEIHEFGSWMNRVWENLPDSLQKEDPFFALCYADDPLSWGDEKQAREIYEKMLSYYEE